MLSVLYIYFETVVSYKRTYVQLSILRSSGHFSYRVSFSDLHSYSNGAFFHFALSLQCKKHE